VAILEYQTPPVHTPKPKRWWVLVAFSLLLLVLEGMSPRRTPPGWPTEFDYLLMLLLPIGAIALSLGTSQPGCLIGLYGELGACTFLPGQLGDTRLHFRLGAPGGVLWFLVEWSGFIFGAWMVCRLCVLFRRAAWR
jgi:hypothetical protein